MSLNKDDLQIELTKRNIYLQEGIKWNNDLMLKKLGDHYLLNNRDKITFGVAYMHSLDNVMLIDHYKDYEKHFNDENNPLKSENWISELKNNGFRCTLVYSPEDGFELFSRRESVKTFVNGVFTDKILFIKNGLIRTPEQYKNVFNYRFVIDCEAMVNSDTLYFDGVDYSSIEDFLQAVLGSLPEKAKNYQKEGFTLYFKVFDALYFEKNPQLNPPKPEYVYKKEEIPEEDVEWVLSHFSEYLTTSGFDLSIKKKSKKPWEKAPLLKIFSYLASLRNTSKFDLRKRPFKVRRQVRDSIVKFLQDNNLPFEYIETEDTDKSNFAEEMIKDGYEGIILKNLEAPYFSALKSSRSHRACFKVKSSISQILANMDNYEDFDVFIGGAYKPKSKNVKDMIGGLTCYIYLIDEGGSTIKHEIANVSGLTHDIKREMTLVDSEGNISLKEEYLNKVIAIDGFGLSHKSLRFSHAKIKDNKLEYKNKSPIECVRDIASLKDMISVRGK